MYYVHIMKYDLSYYVIWRIIQTVIDYKETIIIKYKIISYPSWSWGLEVLFNNSQFIKPSTCLIFFFIRYSTCFYSNFNFGVSKYYLAYFICSTIGWGGVLCCYTVTFLNIIINYTYTLLWMYYICILYA